MCVWFEVTGGLRLHNFFLMKNDYKLYHNAWVCKLPPHVTQKLEKATANIILKQGGYFVRNTYNWDKSGRSSFWYVIKDEFGGIEELPSKVRNQVKKSLKCYDIRMVSPEEMAVLGFDLFNKSRARFGSDMQVSKKQWEQRCSGVGHDYWLAVDRDTGLAEGFGINRCLDDYCNYVSMGVNPDAPKSTYPMYGLIFEMNKYYLKEKGMKYVMDGTRSVTEHSNIQPFLEDKFKFRKAYCDLQVFYKSWLGMAVKLLFPFRKMIKQPKVSAILRQEAWARGMEG